MKNIIAAIVLATLTSTSIAEAALSSHSNSNAGINPVPVEEVNSMAQFSIVPLVSDLDFKGTLATSTEAAPVQVSWSIKGVAKKIGRGAKKVGKKVGKGIKKANRVIVPSEIRNAASRVKRGAVKAGRYIAKHPYGKRCKPNKYLQPVCIVKGKKSRNARDHRSN